MTKPHRHFFHIGVYADQAAALAAIEQLKTKAGFSAHPDGFAVTKQFCLRKPKYLNVTGWVDGFDTYTHP